MREIIDLTGVWRARPDAVDEGERLGYGAADCDVTAWREVAVPSTFEEVAPALDFYEGTVWYRRAFRLPAEWEGRRVAIRFGAVNYHARVWVNGRDVGEHEDPFLPFELEIGQVARFGAGNVVALRADNVRRPGDVPGVQRGWRPFGGVLRPVELICTSRVHLERVWVDGRPAEGAGEVTVRAEVRNDGDGSRRVTVAGEAARVGLEGAGAELAPSERAELALKGRVEGAQPWSPEAPRLYPARVTLSADGAPVDAIEVRFGFRSIEVDGERLLLNGEPVVLTGFNRHEDSPRTGPCVDLETARRDLERMKAAGANFVRLCHYPHDPGELDLCDELGLLAMGEIPLYWWNGLEEGEQACRRKLAAARRQLEAMIRRDASHPSLVIWSVSNETVESRPEVVEGNAELLRLAHRLDPTRPAVHVSDKWCKGEPHFEEDDLVCVNAYPCWPWRGRVITQETPAEGARFWRDELAALHERYRGKPILVTEFGHPSFEGVHGGAFGEEVQATCIESQAAAMDAPYICGMAIWCWADHPWPESETIPRLRTSPFGVVGRERRTLAGLAAARRAFAAKRGEEPARPNGEGEGAAGTPVRMMREHLRDIPERDFPDGFSIRPMRPGEGGLWLDVQRDAEPFFPVADDLFEKEFGADLPATTRRCFFIVNEPGAAVGTMSAWYDRSPGDGDWGRVHWVAVRRAYQRRGLARAGLSHVMRRLAEWHERARLDTQTRRIGAIRLYLEFGFVPDLRPDGAREAWARVAAEIDHPALDALRG